MKPLIILFGLFLLGCHSKEKTTSSNSKSTQPPEQEVIPQPFDQELQNGDLIFHTSLSNQSLAIQIATDSKYSHMGIVYKGEEGFYVFEAVQPVKITPLNDWIRRGKNGHYVVKRLQQSEEFLTTEGVDKMKAAGKKYLGKDYDMRFEWSDDKIYCSELVWKIYKEAFDIEIGELQRIKDFDLSDEVVQRKLKERYGVNIPMEELVITPDKMFKAKNLMTVFEK